ncbi:sensor histidine kinase [Aureimonas jatrophae]|uniref:histidine kinase n=1 Tax=Aureimonas jatrophae TaxID=1166073 RepID=A0A1H0CNX0_9HYPH|nr:HAMP domain-containing sensor histidine kinase [Aureimonas jatrophae]MBB3949314.1 signal transduction histidine kinase [Aureimonas jatrophae]SDN59501.1 Signal transduction histidine kinase [Aureimonas jatrophae]
MLHQSADTQGCTPAARDGSPLPRGAAMMRAGGSSLGARLDALVSPRVHDPERRRAQARRMGALVGGALLLAVSAPAMTLAGAGLASTLAVATLAGLLLVSAAALAGTGEDDLSLAILFTAGAVALGAIALRLDSVWPLALLLAGPAEAFSANRRPLARLMLPAVLAAFGLTGFLSLHGIGPTADGFVGWPFALPILSIYATTLVFRGAPRRAASPSQPFAVLSPDGLDNRAGASFGQRLHLLDRIQFLKAMDDLREGGEARDLVLRLLSGDGRAEEATLRFVPERSGGRLREVRVFREGAVDPVAVPQAAPARRDQAAFLATVSHELRTPLNAIVGFSDMLDGEVFGPFADPRQKEYVALIRRSSEHLLSLVNGLLDMSKIEAGRYELLRERFEVAEVAEAAAAMIRCEAERKGLRLVVRTGTGGETAVADRRACQQILLNLLANAVKFTDRGTVTLSVAVDGPWLDITVCDTGIGIAADDISRLGQPFVQLSQGLARRYEGTGLGLSLVRGLAELHHGTLTIRSTEGRGTTVCVRIPAEGVDIRSDLSENIVALTDARQKTSSPSVVLPSRRFSA